MKSVPLLLLCLMLHLHTSAQFRERGRSREERRWQKVDLLIGNELPEQALETINRRYAKATASGDSLQQLKAQLYLIHLLRDAEESDSAMIAIAETNILRTGFPFRNIWQSIAAQLYWIYYDENDGDMLERERSADRTNVDFRRWGAQRILGRASSLFQASLGGSEALKSIPVDRFDAVIVKGKGTRHLRPTLFDLLANRALRFYEDNEKDLFQPALRFVMNDTMAYAPVRQFVAHRFTNRDSGSMQFQALLIYQDILRMHIDDASPDALLDADLHRLNFVYEKSVLTDNGLRYAAALRKLATDYPGHPAGSTAALRNAMLLREPERQRPGSVGRTKADLRQLVNALDAVAARRPENDATREASALAGSLRSPHLDLQTESEVIPNRPSKVLLTYRNLPRAWIRVLRLTANDYLDDRTNNPVKRKAILQRPVVRQFSVALNGNGDLREHSAEVKIDALPPGIYGIVASADERFDQANNDLRFAICQSTGIAFIQLRTPEAVLRGGYLLDCASGEVLSDVRVSYLRRIWNAGTHKFDVQQRPGGRSGKDGNYAIPDTVDDFGYVLFTLGADSLISHRVTTSSRSLDTPRVRERDFYFTDRSIYRPGQRIFFKGILVRSAPDHQRHETAAGREIEVRLCEAGGRPIASQKLVTSEWGSVSGEFRAPSTGRTGVLQIRGISGQAGISVEEYKRPKFSIQWDKTDGNYRVNDTIVVTGKATSFSGNAIDGASVKYEISRSFSRASYGRESRSDDADLPQGTTTTDSAGRFTIRFHATPDQNVDTGALPVFSYGIEAEVTDINGETRSDATTIDAGYHSLELRTAIPELAGLQDLDSLQIGTINLNRAFKPARLSIRILRLGQPAICYRARYWPAPDQFTMTAAEFRNAFPADAYGNEANPETWPVADTVLELRTTTNARGFIPIPAGTFRSNGRYRLELYVQDESGHEIKERRHLDVFDPALTGVLYSALRAVPGKRQYEPEDSANVLLVSRLPAAPLLLLREMADGRTEIETSRLSGGMRRWQRLLTAADRGGMRLRYLCVYMNRVYTADVDLKVPWSNKELDISWETHRDRLEPGQQERWTMTVRGNRGERLAAELAATLYDASLDALQPLHWTDPGLFHAPYGMSKWEHRWGFGSSWTETFNTFSLQEQSGPGISYDLLLATAEEWELREYRSGNAYYFAAPDGGRMNVASSFSFNVGMNVDGGINRKPGLYSRRRGEESLAWENSLDLMKISKARHMYLPEPVPPKAAGTRAIDGPLRKNLQETAFFFPQLHTDSTGAVRFSFTIPEALTEWRLMAFAHTKDLKTGSFSGSVLTQKSLMVQPGLPRFLRQGDSLTISSKIVNLSGRTLDGTATLEILDAGTLRPLNAVFGLARQSTAFHAGAGNSAAIGWKIIVPGTQQEPVILRIRAKSGSFADGEENTLPVLSNRTLVTETLPLWMNGTGMKAYTFDKLLQSGGSSTLQQHALTIEYTSNPAWLTLQALPYLMEYPYECAEQTFNRYFANALGAHILEHTPRIRAVFERWAQADTTALRSALQQDPELREALLEETPWVLDAETETGQLRNLAQLFNASRLADGIALSARKLREMALPEGGWAWFKGAAQPDRYITQYILTGIGRLRQLGVKDSALSAISLKALSWLDRETAREYQGLKSRSDRAAYVPDESDLQYLYMRSFYNLKPSEGTEAALALYRRQAARSWAKTGPYAKGVTAIVLHRNGDVATANLILQSLRETSRRSETLGMYWLDRGRSPNWWESPIETQALLIAAFSEIANDTASVENMKRWLLRQKQVRSWPTTTATADACYALMLRGNDWLQGTPQVSISLGNRTITSAEESAGAGTGHFKERVSNLELKPEMGRITLKVGGGTGDTATAPGLPSWGAVYWQYFENTDRISAARTPLEVVKTLWVRRRDGTGAGLEPLTGPLRTGDRLTIRLQIRSGQDMEYLQLKDCRAACMEPLNVHSGYRRQGDLGYFESTRDASTSFFFDRLPAGRHTLEYEVRIGAAGDYTDGIATIQCMYAPEFSAHSSGGRIVVGK